MLPHFGSTLTLIPTEMENEIIAPKMFVPGGQLRRELDCISKKNSQKGMTKAVRTKYWHLFL